MRRELCPGLNVEFGKALKGVLMYDIKKFLCLSGLGLSSKNQDGEKPI